MKNAPFTFNRLGQTSRKFFNLRGISIIIYIDDILILSETFENNRMICELPQEKLQNIKSLCKVILANTRVSVRLRQKLMGFVTSTRPAVPMARARSRVIQRMVLDNFKGTVRSANKLVHLSDWAKEEVLWWLVLDIRVCHMSLRSIPVWESDRMATDAMDTAVGSVFRGRVMYKVLGNNVARQTIALNFFTSQTSQTGRWHCSLGY